MLSWIEQEQKFYNLGAWKILPPLAKRNNIGRQDVASLVLETFQKWGLPLKVRICSQWE